MAAQRTTPIINKRTPVKDLPAHVRTPNLHDECLNDFQPVDAQISRGILANVLGGGMLLNINYIARHEANPEKLRNARTSK